MPICIVSDCPNNAEVIFCPKHIAEISERVSDTAVIDEEPKINKHVRRVTKFIFQWVTTQYMPGGFVRRRAYDAFKRLGGKRIDIPADDLAFTWMGPGSVLIVWNREGAQEVLYPDGRVVKPSLDQEVMDQGA